MRSTATRLITAVFALSLCAIRAQHDQNLPSFEVSSVKRVEAGRRGGGPFRGGPGTNSPGRIAGMASMKALLMRAYGLNGCQIVGPAWLDSERYEIDAKLRSSAGKEEVPLMLQALLAERFHLVVHRESRELPFYALVTGKSGPKIQESPVQGEAVPSTSNGATEQAEIPKITAGPNGFPELAAGTILSRSYEIVVNGSDGIRYQHWGRRETMEQLANRLSTQLNRPVIDMTKLVSQYDFVLRWAVEGAGGMIPRTDPPPDVIESHKAPVFTDSDPPLFAALQRQLGLALEQRKGPVTVLIVDRVDKTPTGN